MTLFEQSNALKKWWINAVFPNYLNYLLIDLDESHLKMIIFEGSTKQKIFCSICKFLGATTKKTIFFDVFEHSNIIYTMFLPKKCDGFIDHLISFLITCHLIYICQFVPIFLETSVLLNFVSYTVINIFQLYRNYVSMKNFWDAINLSFLRISYTIAH